MPSSSRIPWISWASARFFAKATLTSPPPRYSGLHLPRPLVRLGDRLLLGAADVDQRHVAVGAEALGERVLARAGRARERPRLVDPVRVRRQRARPPRRSARRSRNARSSGSEPASDAITQTTPGHQAARLTSVCDGRGSVFGCEWKMASSSSPRVVDLVVDPDLVAAVDLEPHRALESIAGRIEASTRSRRGRRSFRSTRSARRPGRGRPSRRRSLSGDSSASRLTGVTSRGP